MAAKVLEMAGGVKTRLSCGRGTSGSAGTGGEIVVQLAQAKASKRPGAIFGNWSMVGVIAKGE
jgi:hypothetical protein